MKNKEPDHRNTVYGQCCHGNNMANCMECDEEFKEHNLPLSTKKEIYAFADHSPEGSLERIKNDIAREEGYESWIDLTFKMSGSSQVFFIDKIAIRYASQLSQSKEKGTDAVKFPIDFAKWTHVNKWVWDVKRCKWVQFQGRGRGFKSERVADLYQLFLKDKEETKKGEGNG